MPPLPGLTWWLTTLGVLLALGLVLSVLVHLAERRRGRDGARHPAVRPLRVLRTLGLPLVFAAMLLAELGFDRESVPYEIALTGIWIIGIYALLTLVRAFMIQGHGPEREQGHGHGHGDGAAGASLRARTPRLFVDLITVVGLLIGVAIVLVTVWHGDLGEVVAALGIGSIVIGLALQDTLGNLIAGLALMFEKPYRVGDWIAVDGLEGRVDEINWRALRLRTRNNEMVVVPNSHMAANTLQNYTAPDPVHAERVQIGFSYQDPPNTAKRVLLQAARATPGVLSRPEPTARVLGYGDSSVDYEVRLFTDDFAGLPAMLDAFNTRIWYAARREGLNIPFPIRTVLHSRVPAPEYAAASDPATALRSVPIFACLDDADIEELGERAEVSSFGRGEAIVREGEAGDAMYVLTRGGASVFVDGARRVGEVPEGGVVGEMAVLCGEARSATVVADADVETLVLRPADMRALLERRPELAEAMAAIVEQRRTALDTAGADAPEPDAAQVSADAGALSERIRAFFRL